MGLRQAFSRPLCRVEVPGYGCPNRRAPTTPLLAIATSEAIPQYCLPDPGLARPSVLLRALPPLDRLPGRGQPDWPGTPPYGPTRTALSGRSYRRSTWADGLTSPTSGDGSIPDMGVLWINRTRAGLRALGRTLNAAAAFRIEGCLTFGVGRQGWQPCLTAA
jgi:hypothetical protein